MTICGCPPNTPQHVAGCQRCGHCAPHFASGACRRVGCIACPLICNSCDGPISATGECRCSGRG